MSRRALAALTAAVALGFTVIGGPSASAREMVQPMAPSGVTLSKSQFALLKQSRPIVERAIAAAGKKADWEMRGLPNASGALATGETVSIGQNTDPATGGTCLIVLNDTDCDVYSAAGGYVMSLENALAILDDADGLRDPASVLSSAQQQAVRERADEQGSANPWLVFPQGSAVGLYIADRLAPIATYATLLQKGLPPVARRGQTTQVERFLARDGSTVYRFTQRLAPGALVLNGTPAKTMRVGYSVDTSGALIDAAVWLDKTYVAGMTFETGEPFTTPAAAPASSVGFPGA